MKPFYLFNKQGVFMMTRIFFRHIGGFNKPSRFNEPLILVANHPASFMDPIIIGANQSLTIHFMVRSDVFRSWLTPIFRGTQMIPIYRLREDGKENAKKNEESFAIVRNLLQKGRAVLFFAEGYTDDTFVRRLKPVKKGPGRVGFETMVECNWSKPLKFQALGLNYSDPQKFRSSLFMSYSKKIDIHDYRELYEENPAAALTKLTRDLQTLMQGEITHAEADETGEFLEHIMRLNRQGMNNEDYDPNLWIEDRFNYSRSLAQELNGLYNSETKAFEGEVEKLRLDLKSYFADQEKEKVKEKWIYERSETSTSWIPRLAFLLSFLPIFLVGAIHSIIPYFIVKRFVEKSFKRSVFWSSAKLVIGWAIFGLLNIPAIFLFYQFVFPSYILAVAYYFLAIPTSFAIAHIWKTRFQDWLEKMAAGNKISNFVSRRLELKRRLYEFDFIQNPGTKGI